MNARALNLLALSLVQSLYLWEEELWWVWGGSWGA